MADVVGGEVARRFAEMDLKIRGLTARLEIFRRQMLYRTTTAPTAGEAIRSAASVVSFFGQDRRVIHQEEGA